MPLLDSLAKVSFGSFDTPRFPALNAPKVLCNLLPFDFGKGKGPEFKFCVIVAHDVNNAAAVVMFTTSQTQKHHKDPKLKKGSVIYKAGEVKIFSQETAIEPHNCKIVPYATIEAAHKNKELTVYGTCLPSNFPNLLRVAITDNFILSPYQKQQMKKVLGL